jgi:hypothetical protein
LSDPSRAVPVCSGRKISVAGVSIEPGPVTPRSPADLMRVVEVSVKVLE